MFAFGNGLRFNLLLEFQESFNECLWARWTSGYIDINRDNPINAFEDVVSVLPVGAAAGGAAAH